MYTENRTESQGKSVTLPEKTVAYFVRTESVIQNTLNFDDVRSHTKARHLHGSFGLRQRSSAFLLNALTVYYSTNVFRLLSFLFLSYKERQAVPTSPHLSLESNEGFSRQLV